MTRHYVTFYSPGTLVAETSEVQVKSWDVEKAVEMARGIKERYNARPYGFRFSTRVRGADDFDSRQSKASPMYYLGGTVETLAQIEARKDPKDRILIANMRGNRWDRVVTNTNSFRWTQPLEKDDVVLDVQL